MVKFDSEMKEYLDEYFKSLENSDIKGKELYLRVLENALELSTNRSEFEYILSFGNEYVARNIDSIKRMPQFKYSLRTIMEKELKNNSNEERVLVPYVEEEIDPYELYVNKDMLKVVMDALAEIKPERREVIEKVIIEGLSYREAAKECNCSHDAIMRKLDKGIFNIRMNFPVAYYRHFNSDSWISLLEERESFKKMTK